MANFRATEYYRIAGVYESIHQIFEYHYCDRCGSFQVETRIRSYRDSHLPQRLIAAFFTVVLVLLVVAFALTTSLGWLILVPFILFLGSVLVFGRDNYLVCHKCGNERFTNGNPFHYDGGNLSVVDVPQEVVVKRFLFSEWEG